MDFHILHIDDDVDCNFLLTEALRREKHIRIHWAPNKQKAKKYLGRKYDLIISDAILPNWPSHLEDILRWNFGAKIIIYSSKKNIDTVSHLKIDNNEVDIRAVFKIFSKSSEGGHNLVHYIKNISKFGEKYGLV